jgi:hypothetical protein
MVPSTFTGPVCHRTLEHGAGSLPSPGRTGTGAGFWKSSAIAPAEAGATRQPMAPIRTSLRMWDEEVIALSLKMVGVR